MTGRPDRLQCMRASGCSPCAGAPAGSALPLALCRPGEHDAKLDASSALAGGACARPHGSCIKPSALQARLPAVLPQCACLVRGLLILC